MIGTEAVTIGHFAIVVAAAYLPNDRHRDFADIYRALACVSVPNIDRSKFLLRSDVMPNNGYR
jgi:hypothetical protein